MLTHEFIEIGTHGGFGGDSPPVQLRGYKLIVISSTTDTAPKLEVR